MTEETQIREKCIDLCASVLNFNPDSIQKMKGSGSGRNYFRIRKGTESYVVCFSEDVEENKTFIRLAGMLKKECVNVPEILGVSPDYSTYLLQYLGDKDLLQDLNRREIEGEKIWKAIEATLVQLIKFQSLPTEKWKKLVGFPPLGRDLIEYDFQYAVDNFFIPLAIRFDEIALRKEFNFLAERLLSYPTSLWGLMFRDFQSRNVMLSPSPFLIDFQSARFGPGIYDVVSFAWQAKAGFNKKEKERIVDIYCANLPAGEKGKSRIIRENVEYWALFRVLQTLGAYGRRGLKEGKPHFVESIPLALENLMELLHQPAIKDNMPELMRMVTEVQIKNSWASGGR